MTTTYAILGLVALAIGAGWHVGLRAVASRPGRAAPDESLVESAATGHVLAEVVDRLTAGDAARTAILLLNVVRAKQPSDELGASVPLLNALDLAAAYVREALAPVPPDLPDGGVRTDDGGITSWLATGRPEPVEAEDGHHDADLLDLFGEREPVVGGEQ